MTFDVCGWNMNVWTEILSRKDEDCRPLDISFRYCRLREKDSWRNFFAFEKLKSYDMKALTALNWNTLGIEEPKIKGKISVFLRLCLQKPSLEYVFNHVKKLMLNCQILNVIFKIVFSSLFLSQILALWVFAFYLCLVCAPQNLTWFLKFSGDDDFVWMST